jgi:hypothetical protein
MGEEKRERQINKYVKIMIVWAVIIFFVGMLIGIFGMLWVNSTGWFK